MVATFDGDELTEPLSSVHTDERTPQRLVLHPSKKHLVCVFSGDVAVYDVVRNGNALAENEESDAPSPADSSPITLKPRGANKDSTGDADADAAEVERVTLADVDIKCATFSPDGTTLAIGLETGEVRLCSWPELKVTKTFDGKHTDAVTGIAFSPDGNRILTTSAESANKPEKGPGLWSVAEGKRFRTLSDPSLPANARGTTYRFAGFGPEGSGVAYTAMNLGGEGYVVKWETEGWTVKSKSKVTRDPISAMAMAPDASTLAVGNSEGHVCIIDAGSLSVRSVDKGTHMIFVTTMAFSTDGGVVLSGSADASACAKRVGSGSGGGLAAFFHYLMILLVVIVLGWLYVTLGTRAAAVIVGGGSGTTPGGTETTTGGGAEGIDLMAGLSMEDVTEAAKVAARAAAAQQAAAGAGAGDAGGEGGAGYRGHDGGEL